MREGVGGGEEGGEGRRAGPAGAGLGWGGLGWGGLSSPEHDPFQF